MSLGLLQRAYSALSFAGSLIVGPLFLLHPRGRRRLRERFGSWNLSSEDCVWLHGASVGEIQGLIPLAEMIHANFPSVDVLITATSPTGLDRLPAWTQGRLLPFDSKIWLMRALGQIKLRAAIFTETELWPTTLSVLLDAQVPVALVNTRMRDATFRRYQALKPLLRGILPRLRVVCAATSDGARKLRELGVAESRVSITGNTKYDRMPSVQSADEAQKLKSQLFGDFSGPVFVLASLHPSEEQPFLAALKKNLARAVFVVAPRRLEKVGYFSTALSSANVTFSLRSQLAGRPADSSVLLLDSVGELEKIFSFSSGVFVGGSLVPVGGHNPLEPAAYGIPVAMGPYADVVAEIEQELFESGGLTRVPLSAPDAAGDFLSAVVHPESAQEMKRCGEKAKIVAQRYQGATARAFTAILPALKTQAKRIC